jgi:hypothetical protein
MASESGSRAGPIIAATVFGILIATSAVVGRFFAKRIQKIPTYAEDWMIYAALLFKYGVDVGGIVCKSR